jgi:hypothetical protein
LKDTHDAVAETLTDDIKATKRFILKQLFALSKQGTQDCTKLKALELLGKACGSFNPAHAKEESHQDLKQTLRQRLVEFEDAV